MAPLVSRYFSVGREYMCRNGYRGNGPSKGRGEREKRKGYGGLREGGKGGGALELIKPPREQDLFPLNSISGQPLYNS